VYIFSVFPK